MDLKTTSQVRASSGNTEISSEDEDDVKACSDKDIPENGSLLHSLSREEEEEDEEEDETTNTVEKYTDVDPERLKAFNVSA